FVCSVCGVCARTSPIVSHPFFFFNDPAPTEIYTLSLHDALPISRQRRGDQRPRHDLRGRHRPARGRPEVAAVQYRNRRSTSSRSDRKSTRLNSSHDQISYAVFCLKKKKKKNKKREKKKKTQVLYT